MCMPVSRQQLQAHQIHHSQQRPNVGCIQHSFYALTGAAKILCHQREGSEYRFMLRAHQAGYLLWPLFCNRFVPADQAFWGQLRNEARRGLQWEYRLLVTIKPGVDEHVFGLAANFHTDHLVVSDPMQSASVTMDFQGFLNARIPGTQYYYHHSLEVLAIDSGEINDYPERRR